MCLNKVVVACYVCYMNHEIYLFDYKGTVEEVYSIKDLLLQTVVGSINAIIGDDSKNPFDVYGSFFDISLKANHMISVMTASTDDKKPTSESTHPVDISCDKK